VLFNEFAGPPVLRIYFAIDFEKFDVKFREQVGIADCCATSTKFLCNLWKMLRRWRQRDGFRHRAKLPRFRCWSSFTHHQLREYQQGMAVIETLCQQTFETHVYSVSCFNREELGLSLDRVVLGGM
jgi:hypothetical protein